MRANVRDGVGAKMDQLRAEAPDLADVVTGERMTLREALADPDERSYGGK